MKKTIFLAASAAFFVSGACAADVIPNHIRHPLHTATVKMVAPKSVVRMGATAAPATSPVPDPTRARRVGGDQSHYGAVLDPISQRHSHLRG